MLLPKKSKIFFVTFDLQSLKSQSMCNKKDLINLTDKLWQNYKNILNHKTENANIRHLLTLIDFVQMYCYF